MARMHARPRLPDRRRPRRMHSHAQCGGQARTAERQADEDHPDAAAHAVAPAHEVRHDAAARPEHKVCERAATVRSSASPT
jgi:hypothetical protein